MAREIVKTNVAVGYADLYTAPFGTAKPADTVVYNGAFTDFESIGATEEGVSLTFGRETNEHRVEEDLTPALITVTSATFTLGFSLAEDTMESMQLAYGGEIAAGTGKRTLNLSQDLTEIAVLFEARIRGGHRRIYIPRAMATGEVETAYRQSESKRLYPVTVQSLCLLSEISIEDFAAA